MIHPIVSSSSSSTVLNVAPKGTDARAVARAPDNAESEAAVSQNEDSARSSDTQRTSSLNRGLEMRASSLDEPAEDRGAIGGPMELADKTVDQMAELGQNAVLAQANQLPPVALGQ